MFFFDSFGRHGVVRKRVYECPMCFRKERNHQLLRQHVIDAHPESQPNGVLSSSARASMSSRIKRMKITLPGNRTEEEE
jgi:hypothetical protein